MQAYNEPPPRSPSPPRRGILRQPTINSFAPFSRRDDLSQLNILFQDIRLLVLQSIEFDVVQTAVNNLQGHQDIKDMFEGVGNMEFIPGTRRLLDILELIQNKQDALEALDDLEAVSGSPSAILTPSAEEKVADIEDESETETEVETDAESESEDENRDMTFSFTFTEEPAPPPIRRQLIFTSDDESDSDDESVDLIANADTEPPSLRF